MKRAIVLVSGGLDSATTLAIARDEGFECIAVSFDYGQRHRVELQCAAKVAQACGAIEHRAMQIDAAALHGSALTGCGDVPLDRSDAQIGEGIPDTYVPARNLVFLSLALAVAETTGASAIFIGANAVDYSGYPDCRGVFLESFGRTANLATKVGVEGDGIEIRSPLLEWTKAQIIRRGLDLGVDFGLTSSCYDPGDDGTPCGRCDSCHIRQAGFAAAEAEDPLP
ncbi:MAG: 7-cyano-7-deazaguanine synthase QueC [Phycisphaerales bacterium]|nr:7-cyano-7-deazaguanine synthase QueC [Phycisphaerales bacterium]